MVARYAPVLPVPVRAWAMTSAPEIATGIISAWMGVGWTKPPAMKDSTTKGAKPSAAKAEGAEEGASESVDMGFHICGGKKR